MNATIEKVKTGVPGFDSITAGGLPKGRTTLICGKSGTAKSILSLQIGCAMAKQGMKPLLIAIEETPEDLVTSGDTLGFGVGELMADKKLTVADLTPPFDGQRMVSGEYDVSGLVHRIEATVKETGATAIVLDSATALFSPRPPEDQMRAHFLQLVHCFRRLNLTAIVTAEAPSDYGQLTTLGVEDYVCDTVVVLRNLVDNERRRRSIEVHKYRRSPHHKGEYPFTITSKGVVIFPLDVAEMQKQKADSKRYPSGLAGLDEITNGGWLRDSIVLVRGPAGSGKTTLAGMYARAGALRGEKVVYYGFEETKPILMRNFAQIGMPMEDLEKAGNLRITSQYPEATSPEDMLVSLRHEMDHFKPSLIVVDSISSIEHSTSQRGFRQFMVGIASLLREHGRSALLTQTTNADPRLEMGAPYMSTIPDAILLMDYDWDARELSRSLRVMKMRGSAHATERRKLSIVPGGLRVEPYTDKR